MEGQRMEIFASWAKTYTNKGFSVIPVNGKDAFLTGWQAYSESIADEETINYWIKKYPNCNLGLVLGPASEVSVLDVDIYTDTDYGAKIFEAVKDLIPYSPFERFGSKGFGRFFAEEKENWCVDFGEGNRIEFFASNRYIVVPPSIHPETKTHYLWTATTTILDVNKGNIPSITSGLKNALLKRKDEIGIQNTSHENSGRNNKLKSIAWAMLCRGEDDSKIESTLLTEDANLHSPPLFSDKNDPQMRRHSPEENVKRFLKSIKKSFINYKKIESFNEEKNKEKTNQSTIIDVKPIAQIRDQNLNLNWLVDRLLVRSGSSLWVATPKAGKSTVLRSLGFCVSTGEDFLGRKVTKGKVLGLFLEDSEDQLKAILETTDMEFNDNFVVHINRVSNPSVELLEETIKVVKPDLIIIDTLQKYALIEKINDYGLVVKTIDQYQALASKYNLHIAFIHHSSNKDKNKEGINKTIGSTGLLSVCESNILLERKDDQRFISSEQRYGGDFPKTEIIFDEDNQSVTLGKRLDSARIESVEKDMLDVLRHYPLGLSKKDLFEKLNHRHQYKIQALSSLCTTLRIAHSGTGRKLDPKIYILSKI